MNRHSLVCRIDVYQRGRLFPGSVDEGYWEGSVADVPLESPVFPKQNARVLVR